MHRLTHLRDGRSERLELLKGESTHEARADGTVVLNVKVPIRQAPQIIT